MNLSRRTFIVDGTLAAGSLAAGCAATDVVASGEDWKARLNEIGFDPGAEGCGVFTVVGDPHLTSTPTATFSAAVEAWNAMSPRPMFALSVGDQLCRISRQFGDRQWPADPKWKASCDREFGNFKRLLKPCKVPFKHVIGNHDTYPDEQDARLYASHFPLWRPYERFDACGVQFMLLNSGHDGSFDPDEEAWIAREAEKLDPKRALVLVAHQTGMLRHRENGVPRMIRKIFSGWKGEFWFLGGHEHVNRLEKFGLPDGNFLTVATHTRALFGYWIYAVSSGSIVARLFVQADGLLMRGFGPIVGRFSGWKTPEFGPMPGDAPDRGSLPVPFENTPGVLWKTFVGENDDKRKYRVEYFPQSDAGHWYFYIGRTTYRLPLKEAPGARHAAFLGNLLHHRKTGEREKVYLSTDNRHWTLCPEAEPSENVYSYAIPPAMRSADWLYLRVDGFGFGADSCIAGYALLA